MGAVAGLTVSGGRGIAVLLKGFFTALGCEAVILPFKEGPSY